MKKVERFRDSVTLTFARGPAISFARIRNVVVVGTEVDRITRLKTTIERDRLPGEPRRRGTRTSLRASAPRPTRSAPSCGGKSPTSSSTSPQRSNEKWGAENVSLLEATLPRFGGEDVLVTLAVDEALDLRIRMIEACPAPERHREELPPLRSGGREHRVQARGAAAARESTFAFAHLKVDVTQFLDAFFQRPEIFTRRGPRQPRGRRCAQSPSSAT